MGIQGQRREAEKYLKNPKRIFYTAGGIAAFGLVLGFGQGEWSAALVIVGIGALYSLLYFYWKKKHDQVYGADRLNVKRYEDDNGTQW